MASIISVDRLSKAYEIYRKPSDLLRELVFGGTRHDVFWALRDISFVVRERERIGIIGPNGAGKSTLLQLITGNQRPTAGSVRVEGKISALLSLTPTWNAEDTGIQNIRFNLLLNGCDPREVPVLTEEIVDFTELGPFVYQPVKTYSSGMSARLSFAIATAISPEILIIDEVLGTGDGYFANKAVKRMRELCDKGKALLFVSHSTQAIQQMCDTALWLENGSIRMHGPVGRVVAEYEADMIRRQEETEREGSKARIQRQMHLVSPEEIGDLDMCRFRVRSEEFPGVTDTHYIQSLVFSDSLNGEQVIPLEHCDIRRDENQAALELLGCEWGRMYGFQDVTCRTLGRRTGARKGGHFMVKRPPNAAAQPWNVSIRLISKSVTHKERLCVDFLNIASGEWELMRFSSRAVLEGEWESQAYETTLPRFTSEQKSRVLAKAKLDLRHAVEILGMSIIAGGEPVTTVREQQPFVLRVKVRCHQKLPGISVNVNISRTDGVYTFYQPSGLDGDNVANFVGDAEFDFLFDSNPFGAGNYQMSVFACNEWSWDNIPPSEIFDRSIASFKFSVLSATPIAFGLINVRVPVTVRLSPESVQAAPTSIGLAQ